MHKQTESIRRQSDRYVDESELPFTALPELPAGDVDLFAAEPWLDGEQPSTRVRATGEPLDNLEITG
jgi:hypothetical protein